MIFCLENLRETNIFCIFAADLVSNNHGTSV